MQIANDDFLIHQSNGTCPFCQHPSRQCSFLTNHLFSKGGKHKTASDKCTMKASGTICKTSAWVLSVSCFKPQNATAISPIIFWRKVYLLLQNGCSVSPFLCANRLSILPPLKNTRWLLGCRWRSTNWSDQLKMIVVISIKRNCCNSMWFLCFWSVSNKGAKHNKTLTTIPSRSMP